MFARYSLLYQQAKCNQLSVELGKGGYFGSAAPPVFGIAEVTVRLKIYRLVAMYLKERRNEQEKRPAHIIKCPHCAD